MGRKVTWGRGEFKQSPYQNGGDFNRIEGRAERASRERVRGERRCKRGGERLPGPGPRSRRVLHQEHQPAGQHRLLGEKGKGNKGKMKIRRNYNGKKGCWGSSCYGVMGSLLENRGKGETFAVIWVRHEQLGSASGHQLFIHTANIYGGPSRHQKLCIYTWAQVKSAGISYYRQILWVKEKQVDFITLTSRKRP